MNEKTTVPKIVIADKAGFCFGVKRAISMAYEQLANSSGKPVYTLGPLVHNPQVIKKLENDGIKSIEELGAYPIGHLLIRTHGVSPAIRKEAMELGYNITDATCPLVKKIHDIVLELQREEYPVLVIGHSSHPEVQGIVGELEGNCRVAETVEDARNLQPCHKLGVVVQTTALWHNFTEITVELLGKTKELRIFNSICHATMERQAAAEDLAGKVSMMIVIGGRNSSNTRRLLEISLRVNPRSYLVESPEEVQKDWFADITSIGLTAGASTPDYIIESVYEKVRQYVES